MKTKVLYHAGCWDGFCAAWVIRTFWGIGEAEYIPVQYGMPPPDVRHCRVFMVDFSYPRPTMIKLFKEAASIIVLDHHKSAEKELEGLGDGHISYCRFEQEKSGARMAWEWKHGVGVEAPWLVDYTEDRDLWRHALTFSEEINAALRSYPLDFDLWDTFYKWEKDPLVPNRFDFPMEGKAIRRRERQIVNDHISHARLRLIAGYMIPAVNATVLYSEIAGELAKEHPFGAVYFDRQDGKRVWSLRSDNNGLDVSEIAKMFGGGGHKHAAGFEEGIPGVEGEIYPSNGAK